VGGRAQREKNTQFGTVLQTSNASSDVQLSCTNLDIYHNQHPKLMTFETMTDKVFRTQLQPR